MEVFALRVFLKHFHRERKVGVVLCCVIGHSLFLQSWILFISLLSAEIKAFIARGAFLHLSSVLFLVGTLSLDLWITLPAFLSFHPSVICQTFTFAAAWHKTSDHLHMFYGHLFQPAVGRLHEFLMLISYVILKFLHNWSEATSPISIIPLSYGSGQSDCCSKESHQLGAACPRANEASCVCVVVWNI